MLLVSRYVSCFILLELSPKFSLQVPERYATPIFTIIGPFSWVAWHLTSVVAPGLLTSVAIFKLSADFGRTGWAIIHVNGLLVTSLIYLF